jgi:type I restriction enzyme R subunit
MSVHAYTEEQLVEQPAIGSFADLGWQTVSALEETFGEPSPGLAATLSHPMSEGTSLGHDTKGEVVLASRLRAALERLSTSRTGSHALPPKAIHRRRSQNLV